MKDGVSTRKEQFNASPSAGLERPGIDESPIQPHHPEGMPDLHPRRRHCRHTAPSNELILTSSDEIYIEKMDPDYSGYDAFTQKHLIPENFEFAFVTLNAWDLRVQLPREACDKVVVLPPYLQHPAHREHLVRTPRTPLGAPILELIEDPLRAAWKAVLKAADVSCELAANERHRVKLAQVSGPARPTHQQLQPRMNKRMSEDRRDGAWDGVEFVRRQEEEERRSRR
ncbi:hypothetical protein K458DRAFT_388584 [Lentithecium fluviatile CBS 122367]|uniref:Uncharacterized protein n=1 Tax=Lentithecium fluviatile CBS 122367 TaxID=1168545 RepID=A0A6G1J2Y4_9PLEO|nr:hypothetical protein K458DRAFT_388584 [Lentithecium fluviatile CBS 122367]